MIEFYNKCILNAEASTIIKECGDKIMEELGISKRDIEKCYERNIVNKNDKASVITNLET